MKSKILISLGIIMISIIAYGYVKSDTVNSDPTSPATPQEEILGIWFLESDANIKIEFLNNGHMKTYVDNTLQADDLYALTNNCNGQTDDDSQSFLQITDGADGLVECNVFNGISENNQLFSFTDKSGRVVIYVR